MSEGMGAADGRAGVFSGIAVFFLVLTIIPVMDGIAKLLGGSYHPLQLVWVRYLVQLVICLPLLLVREGPAGLKSQNDGLQILRALLSVVSAATFFAAIRTMPLADAIAVSFIYPFVIVALAPVVLGERVGIWRWSAVIAGFIGVLIIVRPGFETISGGILLALASGVGYAVMILLTRRLAGAVPPLTTMTITGLTAFVVAGLPMPWLWIQPTLTDLALMIAMGLIGTVCQLLIILAYERAPASVLAPFGYWELVTAALVGFVMFGDWPLPMTWLGMAIIAASGIVIGWREQIVARRRAVVPVPSVPG